jgi:hypothetical protein
MHTCLANETFIHTVDPIWLKCSITSVQTKERTRIYWRCGLQYLYVYQEWTVNKKMYRLAWESPEIIHLTKIVGFS